MGSVVIDYQSSAEDKPIFATKSLLLWKIKFIQPPLKIWLCKSKFWSTLLLQKISTGFDRDNVFQVIICCAFLIKLL